MKKSESLRKRFDALKKDAAQKIPRANESFFNPDLLQRKAVHVGDTITSKPGAHEITPDSLKQHLQHGSFSLLTARNPMGKAASEDYNVMANKKLEADLHGLGAIYHKAKGKWDGNEEQSYMVHHTSSVTPQHIEELGRKYNQEGVIHSSEGKNRVVYTGGEHTGAYHEGEGHTAVPHEKDNYSQVGDHPDKKFALKINFDKMHKNEAGEWVFEFEVVRYSSASELRKRFDDLKKSPEVLDKTASLGHSLGGAGVTGAAALETGEPLKKKKKKKSKLAKGEKGDWKKEGYTISSKKTGVNDELTVEAHHPTDGLVGSAVMDWDEDFKHFIPIGTKVHKDHQRKGLASAMYTHAEKVTGHKVMPSKDQTPEAQKLWEKKSDSNIAKALTELDALDAVTALHKMSETVSLLKADHSEKGQKTLAMMNTKPEDWTITPTKNVVEERNVKTHKACPTCKGHGHLFVDTEGNQPKPAQGKSDESKSDRFYNNQDWKKAGHKKVPCTGGCEPHKVKTPYGSGVEHGHMVDEKRKVTVAYPSFPGPVEHNASRFSNTTRATGSTGCGLCSKTIKRGVFVHTKEKRNGKHLGMFVGADCAKKFLNQTPPKQAEGVITSTTPEPSDAEGSDTLNKMSRPQMTFPNFKKLSTRPDQEVQTVETGRQKEMYGRKVANANYKDAKDVPHTEMTQSSDGKLTVGATSKKTVSQQATRDKATKQLAGMFDRNTLGLNASTKEGPKSAAIAGKLRSKFEEGDLDHQKKLLDHKQQKAAITKDWADKFHAWHSEGMKLSQKINEPGGREAWESHRNARPEKPKKPRAPSKPRVDTAKLSPEKQKVRGQAVDSTIHHEAFHHSMAEIEQHYGKAAAQKVHQGILAQHNPDTLASVGGYISSKLGYKTKSPKFTEEILAHTRDILTNPTKRDSYKKYAGEKADQHIKNMKAGHQKAFEYAKNLKPEDLGKAELEKGIKEIATAAAMGAAALGTPSQTQSAVHPMNSFPARHSTVQTAKPVMDAPKPELNDELKHIAQIESSGGKNKHHAKTTVGLNAGQTAGGSTGLMPIMIKETINKNPDLKTRYGHLMNMDHPQITQAINADPHMEADIANHHWKRLSAAFPSDEGRRAYAWRNGISAAKKASDEEVDNHPYVKKFKGLAHPVAMAKSEQLRARFEDLKKAAKAITSVNWKPATADRINEHLADEDERGYAGQGQKFEVHEIPAHKVAEIENHECEAPPKDWLHNATAAPKNTEDYRYRPEHHEEGGLIHRMKNGHDVEMPLLEHLGGGKYASLGGRHRVAYAKSLGIPLKAQVISTDHHDDEAKKSELAKGLRGDHSKEGYKLSSEHHANHPVYGDEAFEVKMHKDGKEVGSALFRPQADNTWEPTNTLVHKDHQRKGIAKAMYKHAATALDKIAPSGTQTSAAKELWASMDKSEQSDIIEKKPLKKSEEFRLRFEELKKGRFKEIAVEFLLFDDESDDLAKAVEGAPTVEGQIHPTKGYVAGIHPRLNKLMWKSAPAVAMNHDKHINDPAQREKFLSQIKSPQHKKAMSAIIDRIAKDPARHFIPTEENGRHVLRARNIKSLIFNDSKYTINSSNPNLLHITNHERHGANTGPSHYMFNIKVNPGGTNEPKKP